jgi:hypothetical protein
MVSPRTASPGTESEQNAPHLSLILAYVRNWARLSSLCNFQLVFDKDLTLALKLLPTLSSQTY